MQTTQGFRLVLSKHLTQLVVLRLLTDTGRRLATDTDKSLLSDTGRRVLSDTRKRLLTVRKWPSQGRPEAYLVEGAHSQTNTTEKPYPSRRDPWIPRTATCLYIEYLKLSAFRQSDILLFLPSSLMSASLPLATSCCPAAEDGVIGDSCMLFCERFALSENGHTAKTRSPCMHTELTFGMERLQRIPHSWSLSVPIHCIFYRVQSSVRACHVIFVIQESGSA